MPKTAQTALFLLVLMLVVVFARPSLGLNPASDSSPPEAVSPAENLDSRFWLADTLDLQAELNARQVTLNEWIQSVNQSNLEFLCLGEIHNPSLLLKIFGNSSVPVCDMWLYLVEVTVRSMTWG